MASESFVVEHHRRLDDGESCESPQTIDAYAVENLTSSSSGPFFPSRIVNPHPTMTTTMTLRSLAPRSTVVLVNNHPHPVDVECRFLFFIFSMFGLKNREYHDDCICHCCRCCA